MPEAKDPGDRTDYAKLEAMTEAELEASIAADPDWKDVPRDWYVSAEAVRPNKVPVSMRLDADVAARLRATGRGWQTRTNAILRTYLDAKARSDAR